MAGDDAFSAARPRLLALAYRLLGSWSEAEDAVQDAWIRWQAADRERLAAPEAWLRRVVTNRCLDVLKSSRQKRETYTGPWLPEPVPTDQGRLAGEPVDPHEVSLAFLMLLERLTPLERAVYVLSEAFGHTADEVAALLDREPAAVRQLLHRAREHVRGGRPRFAPDQDAHQRLLGAFAAACASGDLAAIEATLADDVVATSDGGGRARAALRPVSGKAPVARLMAGLAKKAAADARYELREVNGWPALVAFLGDRPFLVLEIETDGALVYGVNMVLNPEKLATFA